MKVRHANAPLGAEIFEVDLTQPVADETFREIEELFHDRGVIVFREQHLTDEQQIAFSRRFGELEIHPAKMYLKPGHPEILVVSNVIEDGRPIGLQDAGQYWHTDLSYMASPSRCSLLYAHEVPIQDGKALGDTLFVSTTYAYDTLGPELRDRIEPLTAVHGYADRYRMQAAKGGRATLSDDDLKKVPDVVHRVARLHPWTGRKTLFVNEGFTTSIEGMPKEESDAVLRTLFDHITRPEAIYRHVWRPGDLLMWDNGSTQHRAVANYALPLRRRMQRTTVRGR
ncbi:MAG TPA: TauD/TfdA family dioxygenase [Bryobacteraceae bacterium]|nr:TauD/TfdA family dioxygenase [Bryobacteraceae bacterium]